MTWMRPMDPYVAAVAAAWFHLPDGWEDRATSTPPVGLVVGEQPGARSNARLPMWPYPSGSAGGRLAAMSGMGVSEYLVRLARTNLMPNPVARWHKADAMDRAAEIAGQAVSASMVVEDWPRLVLCGVRVTEAFGLDPIEWFRPVAGNGVACVAVPHPSGRNHAYNDYTNRHLARSALRWAARMADADDEGVIR